MTAGDVAGLVEKIEALHEDVLEVKTLAQETNGRVRKLEAWRTGIDMLVKIKDATAGTRAALYVGVAGAGVGGFIAFLLEQALRR